MHRRVEQQEVEVLDDALEHLRKWIMETSRDDDPEFGIDPFGDGWNVWREINS